MTIDTLFKRALFAILVILWAWQMTSCDESTVIVDIENNYNYHYNDSIVIDCEDPRNACVSIYYDIHINATSWVQFDARPDSMQYLAVDEFGNPSWTWELESRLTGHKIYLDEWDAVVELPFRDEYWDVRFEVQYYGDDENIPCSILAMRVFNVGTGFVSN